MKIQDRFIKYTTFDSQSCEGSKTVPSTDKQWNIARYLKEEMEQEGLTEVTLDEKGYLYGTLPASEGMEDMPVMGFISHYDTSPDCSGANIKARIINGYDGKAIELSEGIWSTPEKFPELKEHVGEDLIVTDGTTLLGADDKAGIAEIMQAMCYLRDHKELKHGKIRVAFNPDEEIGMGAHNFNVKLFGCQWAYTVDGGDLGELEYENFNAAGAKIQFNGMSVHTGYAKDKMINAGRVAMEFASMMPQDEIPEKTEGYEGFYHMTGMEGNCEKAMLSYIIRDHDREKFEKRKDFIRTVAKQINDKYGDDVCNILVHDQYYNMLEKVQPVKHIIDSAMQAMKDAGVTPKVQPIRGGTDGAQLSFQGLPCPNLFTGAINFHGPHEFVSIQVMEKAMQTIVNLCQVTSDE